MTALSDGPSSRSIRVSADEAGERLDRILSARLGASRTQIRRLLARGDVALAGRPLGLADKGAPVRVGDQLEVSGFRLPGDQRILPEPEAPLVLLAEGPGWLAVDKPAGKAVHPFGEEETGSVLNAVAARHSAVQGVGEGGLRSGVVHRLDVDTSGVLLVASADHSWQRLRKAFHEQRVYKLYRALVHGAIERPLSLRLAVRVAQHRPARVRVVATERMQTDPDVRMVSLEIRPLESLRGATLIEVQPASGFLHQIRASLAHLGHPLLGDGHYGAPDDDPGVQRHLLHAARLAFEEIEAESPDPEDFAAQLVRLRS